jgi:hypothetical protein
MTQLSSKLVINSKILNMFIIEKVYIYKEKYVLYLAYNWKL